MPQDISVPAGEDSADAVKLVAASDPTGSYNVDVKDADVLVAYSSQRAPEGQRYVRGRETTLKKHNEDMSIWAFAPDDAATVAVTKTTVGARNEPPINESSVAHSDGVAFSHDPSVDGAQLPDNAVPAPTKVAVRASGGTLGVGFESGNQPFEVDPGAVLSLDVTNTNVLFVSEVDTGATAQVLFED